MPTGWLVKVIVTGEDAWSVEFTSSEQKVIAMALHFDLDVRLHNHDRVGANTVTRCIMRNSLDEFESPNLTIRKLHM